LKGWLLVGGGKNGWAALEPGGSLEQAEPQLEAGGCNGLVSSDQYQRPECRPAREAGEVRHQRPEEERA